MGAVLEDREARAADALGEHLAAGEREQPVVAPEEHRRRNVERSQMRTEVGVERAHEVLEVARHRADRVAGPWMRRLAVATQVDGDEREAVAERLDLAIPERPVAGPAMDQEDERARAHPVIAERDAGVREKWHPALVPWASRPRNMGWPIPVSAAGC